MPIAREKLRWNGWGRSEQELHFPPEKERQLLAALRDRLRCDFSPLPEAPALEHMPLPPVKLESSVLDALRRPCGEAGVRTSSFERIAHALGKSFPDLLRLRFGEIEVVPDAVVYPPDEGAVSTVLRIAAEANLAVIPFGGGTSVVGGVTPRPRPDQTGVLALDTTRLNALVHFDSEARTVTFQAGIDGPGIERALAQHGYTLGHFPQSFEYSTLGGWIAARSCGQESDFYGGIEDLLVSVRLVTPEGVVRTLPVPRSATGPDLNELVLGSEGVFGVIVEATLRVQPLPRAEGVRGSLFPHFRAGLDCVREIVQEGVPLTLLRLSDAEETSFLEELRREPRRRFDLPYFALAAAAHLGFGKQRSLLIYGTRGRTSAEVRSALARVRSLSRKQGTLPLGSSPGRRWKRERFNGPYLRDWLLGRGLAIDTVETALPWSRVVSGHETVTRALRAALQLYAGGGLVMAHLSHSYTDGACLYFTFLYPLDAAAPLDQWQSIRETVTQAMLGAGGTLSHHHGVGADCTRWLLDEKGALGVSALRALKRQLDPRGIMNPSKLLPPSAE